jgi:hypothetical protein
MEIIILINGNGNVCNSSSSYGILQSDKIAIEVEVEVWGGVMAVIGMYLAYLQLKRSETKGQHQQPPSATPASHQSQHYGSSWPGPHS